MYERTKGNPNVFFCFMFKYYKYKKKSKRVSSKYNKFAAITFCSLLPFRALCVHLVRMHSMAAINFFS